MGFTFIFFFLRGGGLAWLQEKALLGFLGLWGFRRLGLITGCLGKAGRCFG